MPDTTRFIGTLVLGAALSGSPALAAAQSQSQPKQAQPAQGQPAQGQPAGKGPQTYDDLTKVPQEHREKVKGLLQMIEKK